MLLSAMTMRDLELTLLGKMRRNLLILSPRLFDHISSHSPRRTFYKVIRHSHSIIYYVIQCSDNARLYDQKGTFVVWLPLTPFSGSELQEQKNVFVTVTDASVN